MGTKKIKELVKKQSELIRGLDRSMALEVLWPEVFNHGSASSYWLGKVHSRGGLPHPLHFHHEFVVTNGLKEKRYFSYHDVPVILGGGDEKLVSIKSTENKKEKKIRGLPW